MDALIFWISHQTSYFVALTSQQLLPAVKSADFAVGGCASLPPNFLRANCKSLLHNRQRLNTTQPLVALNGATFLVRPAGKVEIGLDYRAHTMTQLILQPLALFLDCMGTFLLLRVNKNGKA